MRFVRCLVLLSFLGAPSFAADFPVEISAGGSGLGGPLDQFQTELRATDGDFDVKIRVESLSLADVWSEAGLIARESAASGARFAAALSTPSISGCLFKARGVTDQPATLNGSFPVNYPDTWLRLQRLGNTFAAYGGLDGRHWARLGSTNIAMPATVLLGYGAASHNLTNNVQAVFSGYEPVSTEDALALSEPIEPLAQSSRLTSLVLSEIMYHPPDRTDGRKLEFIELFNSLATPADLSGYRISGDVDFSFPPGTVLAGGEFLVVARNPGDVQAIYGIRAVFGPFDNGASLPNDSGVVRLRNRQGAVLLEVPYSSRSPWPEAADGKGSSLVLVRPSLGEADPKAWAASDTPGGTPGAINTRRAPTAAPVAEPLSGEVVFNEIMYHPISENDDDQYIELFNARDVVADLSAYAIEGGIHFTFPNGTMLAPGGYLVIARNAGRLRTNYTGLNSTNTLANFSGRLSHSGERLSLRKADGTLVDQLTYSEGGQWGQWSDGGGSSLEKIDPHADSRFPSNWADSDETHKAEWTTISVTGRLDNGNVAADQLQVLLQGAGECLIDEVQVLNASGINLIANSTFENDAVGWTPEGTEQRSSWELGEGYSSSRSFHIRAAARGDNQVNRVRTPLTSSLSANSTATISARVRWLRGNPYVLLRLRGNWLEAAGRMDTPKSPGTPGARNSRIVSNAGPVISEVRHSPVLPEAGEPVIVSARVSDPEGLRRVILRYRIDPAADSTGLTMVDDGTNGDLVAGDGIYAGIIPGQSAGTLVAFKVVAQDTQDALTTFPALDTDREALVRFGEQMPSGNFPVYRLWMTQATLNEWTTRQKLNNSPLNITFVSGNSRVIYGAQALYAGSPYIAPGYFSPAGGRCGYTVIFPSDDRFLGNTELVLDWPGGHGGERTALQEQMAYWLAEQMELPYSHRYSIRLFVNGISDMQRGSVFEAVNQPASDFLKAWVPNDSAGDFYKIDRAFEFADNGGLAVAPQPRLQNFTTTGGVKKTASYRWNFMKRAAVNVSDYTNIFNLVDALNAPSPEPYTSATGSLADVNEWMGIFAFEHIIANFDAYGHEIGKNMYAYKPQTGRWQLYAFDLDWLMLAAKGRGATYDPSSAPLFNSEDPTITRMYNHPPFRRAYLQAVKLAVDGPMQNLVCDPVMDAKYQSLVANGITMCDGQSLTDPSAVKTWFAQRRAALVTELNKAAALFAITSNNGSDLATNVSTVTLTGTAPLEVASLLVNGVESTATWNSVTEWATEVPLVPGLNILHVTGHDTAGRLLFEDSINVTAPVVPQVAVQLENGMVRLSWNSQTGAQYLVEQSNDLSGWSETQTLAATAAQTSISLPGAAVRQRFYRIRLSL